MTTQWMHYRSPSTNNMFPQQINIATCIALYFLLFVCSAVIAVEISNNPCTQANSALEEQEQVQFFEQPTMEYDNRGRTVHLTCIVFGTPQPNIRWLHNRQPYIGSTSDTDPISNELLNPGKKVIDTVQLVSTIKVSAHMGGIYTCVASTDCKQISHDFDLAVDTANESNSSQNDVHKRSAYAPQIYMYTTDMLEFYDRNIRLTCRAVSPHSQQPPTIKWLETTDEQSEPVPVETMPELYKQLSNGDLLVSRLAWKDTDNPAKTYSCVATNAYGTAQVDGIMVYTALQDETSE